MIDSKQPGPGKKRSLIANVVLAGYLLFGAFCGLVVLTSPSLGPLTKGAAFIAILGAAYFIFLAHEAIWRGAQGTLFKRR